MVIVRLIAATPIVVSIILAVIYAYIVVNFYIPTVINVDVNIFIPALYANIVPRVLDLLIIAGREPSVVRRFSPRTARAAVAALPFQISP